MATAVPVGGLCDPAFAAVADAFAENFAGRDEVGASVAVWVDGRMVVDLWGGWADGARTRPWGPDTLVDVFSVGKGLVAVAVLGLLSRGALGPDRRVAGLWPAFGAAGKDEVTVRQLLSHQAGLPGVASALPDDAMYRWDTMTAALEAEAPWWPPGTGHGYHVNTFGFLAGEVVRRVSGKPFDRYFAEHVAGPLGADIHFGTRPAEDARTAEFLFPEAPRRGWDGNPWGRAIYANPPGLSGLGVVNTRPWRAAVHPSTAGHANARSVAQVYAVLAAGGTLDGVTLGSAAGLERATAAEVDGHDRILDRPSRFGLGFQLAQPERALGGPASFGHFGAGGSLGFADPEHRLAFGYAMNRFGHRWLDPRNRALVAAAYASL